MKLDGVKGRALWLFGRLPMPLKLRLVRAGAPSFTVGAMVCIERDDEIIVTRSPHKPDWSLPGGQLRRREEPADAARREIVEELGVRVDLLGDPVYVLDVQTQRCDVLFHARLSAGETEPHEVSFEITEWRWARRDALPLLHPHSAKAMAALARVVR